jgi:cystathionine beta-lyase/cystathionine gamma-synthase
MKFATKAIHSGTEPDPSTGAVVTPIFQTSTYAQEEVGVNKGYSYSRTHNPTRSALEKSLASLENGRFGACFSSGVAAIDCMLRLLSPGDEVISTANLYGGTYRLFNTIYAKYGITFRYISMRDSEELKAALTGKTKMIWVETPSNPTLEISDIRSISDTVKGSDVIVVADNTFSSPFLQNPLELGAHVVMHSVSKYLSGHSDVIMGALITNEEKLASEIHRIQNSCGAICGPQDAFLVLRGIKTLHVRMQRHCENAAKVAEFLVHHPKIEKVNYPGLPSHPLHEIAKRQMRGFGGMISFSLKNDTVEAAHHVMKKCRLFTLAESLGGIESLMSHPTSMSHSAIPKDERLKTGIFDSLIRLSVGIEDVDDLIYDLNRALE